MGKRSSIPGWAAAALMLAAGAAKAQTAGVEPFQDFVAALKTATAEPYLAPRQAIVSAAEFGAMRDHLLRLYDGVTVRHSYVFGGQVFDCVPIAQQPSLRLSGRLAPASPPPSPPGGAPAQTSSRCRRTVSTPTETPKPAPTGKSRCAG